MPKPGGVNNFEEHDAEEFGSLGMELVDEADAFDELEEVMVCMADIKRHGVGGDESDDDDDGTDQEVDPMIENDAWQKYHDKYRAKKFVQKVDEKRGDKESIPESRELTRAEFVAKYSGNGQADSSRGPMSLVEFVEKYGNVERSGVQPTEDHVDAPSCHEDEPDDSPVGRECCRREHSGWHQPDPDELPAGCDDDLREVPHEAQGTQWVSLGGKLSSEAVGDVVYSREFLMHSRVNQSRDDAGDMISFCRNIDESLDPSAVLALTGARDLKDLISNMESPDDLNVIVGTKVGHVSEKVRDMLWTAIRARKEDMSHDVRGMKDLRTVGLDDCPMPEAAHGLSQAKQSGGSHRSLPEGDEELSEVERRPPGLVCSGAQVYQLTPKTCGTRAIITESPQQREVRTPGTGVTTNSAKMVRLLSKVEVAVRKWWDSGHRVRIVIESTVKGATCPAMMLGSPEQSWGVDSNDSSEASSRRLFGTGFSPGQMMSRFDSVVSPQVVSPSTPMRSKSAKPKARASSSSSRADPSGSGILSPGATDEAGGLKFSVQDAGETDRAAGYFPKADGGSLGQESQPKPHGLWDRLQKSNEVSGGDVGAQCAFSPMKGGADEMVIPEGDSEDLLAFCEPDPGAEGPNGECYLRIKKGRNH